MKNLLACFHHYQFTPFNYTMPTGIGNILHPLSEKYNIYLSGINTTQEEIGDIIFDGTLYVGSFTPLPWHKRPFIFCPDNDIIAPLCHLRAVDGIIAFAETTTIDARLVSRPCLLTNLPVDYSFFQRLQIPVDVDINRMVVTYNNFNCNFRIISRIIAGLFQIILYAVDNITQELIMEATCLPQIDGEKNNVVFNPYVDWYSYSNAILNSFGTATLHPPYVGAGTSAVIAAFGKRISVGLPDACQRYLYPELTSWNIIEIREKLSKLKQDSIFYRDCATKAFELFPTLGYKNSLIAREIINFVKSII